jgi:phosphatidate cytidylyltransferase
VAKIQSGLLVCVYCLSFAPALLYLKDIQPAERSRLLFFFVTMSLLSEALQYIWSRTYGQHVIAPAINATRTWEGLLGGTASTALVAWALSLFTPFTHWQAALMGMSIAVMGFAGAMTMSAIKRDRGVRDYGTLVEGHGGVLDRIDAICFAAPVFYHVTRQILA